MNEPQTYTFVLDGPLFRRQRMLLDRLTACARRKEPYQFALGDLRLLDGLVAMTDAIADQAHDQYGIDCLLVDDKSDAGCGDEAAPARLREPGHAPP